MNNAKRTVYLLLAALAVASCGRIERRVRDHQTVTITRSWPASAIHELQVYEVGGRISIEAIVGNAISMVATARGELEPEANEENQGLFETRLEGDTLHIGRREHRRRHFDFVLFDRNDVEIDYVLKVPASVSLDLRTVNGRIVTRGTEGETVATSVNGSIDVETAGTKELNATTVNGRVKAKFTRSFQGARFKSVNGGVQAILPNDASFTVDLSQVNGDFEASFPLSIHSNPGSRRVSGEVNGGEHELKIVTVNGDIELSRLGDSR